MQWNPAIVCNKAKGRILKRVLQENKARQIFQKTNVSVRIRGKKCSFFRIFGVLVTPGLRFSLLPSYRHLTTAFSFKNRRRFKLCITCFSLDWWKRLSEIKVNSSVLLSYNSRTYLTFLWIINFDSISLQAFLEFLFCKY